jgi:hypothetical protein
MFQLFLILFAIYFLTVDNLAAPPESSDNY